MYVVESVAGVALGRALLVALVWMAGIAGETPVATVQGKLGPGVVEPCLRPSGFVVAVAAGLPEPAPVRVVIPVAILTGAGGLPV